MDSDSEHKGHDSDDGWVLDSEWTWEKESEILSESDNNTVMLTVEESIFIGVFLSHRPDYSK